jgi:hypothetical protein
LFTSEFQVLQKVCVIIVFSTAMALKNDSALSSEIADIIAAAEAMDRKPIKIKY